MVKVSAYQLGDYGPKRSLSKEKYFSLQAEKLELWKVVSEISRFFGVNIIVYDDIKDKIVSFEFDNLTLIQCLNAVSWSVGVEYVDKDGIYYLGGNADNVQVLESTGISDSINAVFGNQVKTIGDKIVITGTERQVKRISDAVTKLQEKESCIVKVTGYEVSDDMMRKLGIDIDKAVKYSFSWESMLANQCNPIQMAVVSFAMSIQAEQSQDEIKQVLNSYVGIVSGVESKIQLGESVDREIYTTSQYGVQVVSGFNNQQTGLQVILNGFKYEGGKWVFGVYIENSTYLSDTKKNLFNVKNSVLLLPGETSLVGRIVKGVEEIHVTKGIPFLCDIPYLGYLFSVHTTRAVNKQVLFFLQFVNSDGLNVPEIPSEPVFK